MLSSSSPRKTGRNLPLRTINKESRKVAGSDYNLDQSNARYSGTAPSVSPPADEPVEWVFPAGLNRRYAFGTEICTPLFRRVETSDLKQQNPRATRAVLTAPFSVDAFKIFSTYMADVSPPQLRWTGQEPPALSRNVPGTADATGPCECVSSPGPDEGPVRLETG